MNNEKHRIRKWLKIFIAALFLSGLTAIPVEKELIFIINHFPFEGSIKGWLQQVLVAVQLTGKDHPFLFYGLDWLAFAHFILAILFIGPLRDPIKNKWVIEFGIIACILIIPFAMIAGYYRDIPLWWRLIDCSFGIIGLVPLGICLQKIWKLEKEQKNEMERITQYNISLAEN